MGTLRECISRSSFPSIDSGVCNQSLSPLSSAAKASTNDHSMTDSDSDSPLSDALGTETFRGRSLVPTKFQKPSASNPVLITNVKDFNPIK
jgi:hypothetical protein